MFCMPGSSTMSAKKIYHTVQGLDIPCSSSLWLEEEESILQDGKEAVFLEHLE